MNNGPKSSIHSFFTPKTTEEHSFADHADRIVSANAGEAIPSARTVHTPLEHNGSTTEAVTTGNEAGLVDGSNQAGLHGSLPSMCQASTEALGHAVQASKVSHPAAWPISAKGLEPKSKRRKVHHEGIVADSQNIPPNENTEPQTTSAFSAKQTFAIDGSSDVVKDSQTAMYPESERAAQSPPRKMLKLSASGKLASPKLNKPASTAEIKPKRKGRPKRSLLAICRYSILDDRTHTQAIGARIADILCGAHRHIIPTAAAKVPTKPPQQSGPPKSTHPFFTGRRDKGPDPTAAIVDDNGDEKTMPSPHRKSFASTPGKIKLQVAQMKSERLPPPSFNPVTSAPSRTNTAKGEVWPGPGMLHIRGVANESPRPAMRTAFARRKKKLASTTPFSPRTFLDTHAHNDTMSEQSRARDDGFTDPHPSLRVPERSLMTGPSIARSILPQLSSTCESHPANGSIAKSLQTHLTAYDHGRGEPLPWTSKYAPLEAATVLQASVDAMILRDWMRNLAVNAVGGSLPSTKPKADLFSKKKRRKRVAELDDFVVSSGDEDEQFGALGGLEEFGSQSSSQGASRTLVRSGPDSAHGEPAKLANAVVLSGPHGCGKTAMVFAVAKELGYQVFEINSGSRRSGRDVMERIGDVVANHIVSHGKMDTGNLSADEDSKRITDAFQKDLDSGRQGTMNSFFTSAPRKAAPISKVTKQRAAEVVTQLVRSEPSRSQKQSIILLEEVDILFEEDKAFWTTIIALLTTSRRPVVMTCTDEFVLPLDELVLHAMIRLCPPPMELTVDYLLLLAAREGHLLSRPSVEALYEYKRGDLRASITDLQFWCQMGVGDPRGGLSWIFQRWPPGTGIDADGYAQRVVSRGTHHVNMGCFPCEREEMSSDDMQQAMLAEAWENWSLDPRDEAHLRLPEALAAATDPEVTIMDRQSRLVNLRKMETLTETLSALDLQCMFDLPVSTASTSRFDPLGSLLKQHMDVTQPEMTPKARTNFTETPKLLQTDEAVDYMQLSRPLAISCLHFLPSILGLPPTPSRLSALIKPHNPYDHLSSTPGAHIYGALDPLAEPMIQSSVYTTLFAPISALTVDVAPYVRSIAAHDAARATQYADLGGKRKTRAARGAVEGRGRGGVRRERWWDCELDLACTAGEYIVAAGDRVAEWAAMERAKVEEELVASQGSV